MEFLFPPHPKGKMESVELEDYEATGLWVVQRKYNGQRIVIHRALDGKISISGKGQPITYQLPTEVQEQVRQLAINPAWEYWFDGELLNTKTTTPYYKNRIILFDVLWAGVYLFKSPDQMVRLNLLNDICRNPEKREPKEGIALRVSENLWMAETFDHDFRQRYEEFLHLPEIEGLVLRKKNSSIDRVGTSYYEVSWLIRCRKPSKNYQF